MLRKDYLGKQLEALSTAIAKLILEMKGQKTNADAGSVISRADEFSKAEFDAPLNEILACDPDQFLDYLTKKKQLSIRKIDLLADLLFATIEFYEKSEKQVVVKSLYEKILAVYDHVNKTEKTFSADRQEKITILKSK